ncbi:unnamed protein product [Brachionus calyciflorus]|uniref:t-SNARE coiled-coil homology domain-containing protein n=1 Tax=Brachionus calyciflorus TaxID=104777 RepID=A0A813RZG9_9BILA|nr:unnamed protein product [Brachionus calyciflorus]
MIKDRLKELKMNQPDPDDIQLTMSVNKPTQVDGFLRESDQLERTIDKIGSLVNEIKRLQESILVSSGNDETLRDELDDRMNEIKSNAQKIRQNLKIMTEEILREEKENRRGSTELKIKKTRTAFLSKKFSEIMQNYNLIQANYRDDCKKRIKRQLEITGKDADDEEIEEMLESNNPQIFTQGILTETKMAKQALQDIEARHKDIKMLEKNILELHEMFADLAELIETQGEMVDNIEDNMAKTVEDAKVGEDNTKKAVVNAKSARKKKVIVGLIITGVVLVVIIIIVILLAVYLK